MKMVSMQRFNTLALAILAAVSLTVRADINPGTGTAGSSSGELFLSVWDQTQLKSYSLDLGVTADQLLSVDPAKNLYDIGKSYSFSLGDSFAGMYKAGDTLSFNMVASNKYVGVASPEYGFIVSHNINALQALPNIAQTIVQQDATKIGNWATTLNTAQDAYNGFPVNTGAYAKNFSEVSTYGTSGPLGNSSYYGTAWTNSLSGIIGNGSATATDTSTVTQTLQLYFYGDTVGVGGANKPVLLGNGLVFSLNASSNTLSFSSLSPVPEPEEWLLMLLGLPLIASLAQRKLA